MGTSCSRPWPWAPGRLALGYASLVAYREKGLVSFPGEVEKAVEAARGEVGGKDRRLVYVADRKVFSQMQGLGEDFVIRVYWDRKRGNVVSLKEAVASLPFASGGEVRLKLGEGGVPEG